MIKMTKIFLRLLVSEQILCTHPRTCPPIKLANSNYRALIESSIVIYFLSVFYTALKNVARHCLVKSVSISVLVHRLPDNKACIYALRPEMVTFNLPLGRDRK